VSTVKNYENLLSVYWGSDPLNISATPFSTHDQGSYDNTHQACSSRVL